MAVDARLLLLVVVVCLSVVAVSTAPVDHEDVGEEREEARLASRTLLAAAVFDGRVMSPLVDGRLLFRVRRVYKGWHAAAADVQPVRRRATRLNSADVNRLIFVSCGSSELSGRGRRSDGCRLGSAVVRRRYLVFAVSFHAVIVGGGHVGRATPVGVYRTSGPLVPVTARARRVTKRYSDLSFGQYRPHSTTPTPTPTSSRGSSPTRPARAIS